LLIQATIRASKGKVLAVNKTKMRAVVEGLNMVSKHTKPNAKTPQGGIIKQEASIHISNLQVVDPVKGGPTKIGRRLNDKGKLVRYAKKSGEEIK
jgi:large subunit ribosomal protein L24